MGNAGIVMLLNAAVQCLLLLGTERLCRCQAQLLRVLLGGTVGGLYAGVCLLRGCGYLADPFWRFSTFVITVILTFGIDLDALRRGAIYVLLNMALEGIVVGLGADTFWYCVIAVGVLGILCVLGFYRRQDNRDYLPVEIIYHDKQVRVVALRDTGNMLTDPLTGQPVLIISPQVASQITGLSSGQLQSPLEAMVSSQIPGLRLIPYRTIGQGSAFLLALRMQVKLGDKKGKCLVAFAPEGFGQGSTYQALTGGTV